MEKISNLFINRKEELTKLNNGLRHGDDFVLIAPRRFGKTALALQILEDIKRDENFLIIDIDLMSYASGTIRSIAECIIEKSLNALGLAGKIRQLWKNLDFSFELKIKYRDLEIEPLISMFSSADEWLLLEHALNLPEKIAKQKNKQVVVFYDEFGELTNLGDRVIKLFRSVIQRHKQVSYLFAGSQETAMNNIFLAKTGAFYRFGELIYLRGLAKKDVFTYILTTYPHITTDKTSIQNISIIEDILDSLKGHPYYTAQAIKYLARNPACDVSDFANFIRQDLLERERAYLEQQLLNISRRHHATDILRILALNLNPYEELTLNAPQIYKILNYLENSGYIFKLSRGIYKIVDPLMELLLTQASRMY